MKIWCPYCRRYVHGERLGRKHPVVRLMTEGRTMRECRVGVGVPKFFTSGPGTGPEKTEKI